MQAHSSNVVATAANLRIDGTRLWDRLMQFARFGATDKGGVWRLALTELDRETRDQLIAWAKEIGCTVGVDAIDNIFARRAGLRDDLPSVIAGSHIDTQPTGGKFDGNCCVLAGLEVLRTLDEAIAPLEVAVWTNEEGSRFVPVMMGSGAFMLEHALAQCDGVSVPDALEAIGCAANIASHILSAHISKRTTGSLASCKVRMGTAATTWPCTAWKRTRARRRWRCVATRCSSPRI